MPTPHENLITALEPGVKESTMNDAFVASLNTEEKECLEQITRTFLYELRRNGDINGGKDKKRPQTFLPTPKTLSVLVLDQDTLTTLGIIAGKQNRAEIKLITSVEVVFNTTFTKIDVDLRLFKLRQPYIDMYLELEKVKNQLNRTRHDLPIFFPINNQERESKITEIEKTQKEMINGGVFFTNKQILKAVYCLYISAGDIGLDIQAVAKLISSKHLNVSRVLGSAQELIKSLWEAHANHVKIKALLRPGFGRVQGLKSDLYSWMHPRTERQKKEKMSSKKYLSVVAFRKGLDDLLNEIGDREITLEFYKEILKLTEGRMEAEDKGIRALVGADCDLSVQRQVTGIILGKVRELVGKLPIPDQMFLFTNNSGHKEWPKCEVGRIFLARDKGFEGLFSKTAAQLAPRREKWGWAHAAAEPEPAAPAPAPAHS